MLKAIALIRTSTTNQEVDIQTKEVLSICYADGLSDDEIIIVGGKGLSAIKQDEAYRKNIARVFELLDTTPSIKTVYAFAVDRIGRVMSTLSLFRETLVERHIQLVIKEPYPMRLFNQYGEEDKMVEQQFYQYSFYAKQEMELKKVRMKQGRIRNKERGKHNGGIITYGYKLNPDNKKFEINEDEAKVVRMIFNLIDEGYTLRRTVVELNDRGILKHHRITNKKTEMRPFTLRSLNNIVKTQDYTGEGDNIRPQIISRELYDRVQARLKSNIIIAPKENKHFWFGSKLLKCADCGKYFSPTSGVYRCNTFVEYSRGVSPTECHNGINIKTTHIDAALLCAGRDEYYKYLEGDREAQRVEAEKKIVELTEKQAEKCRQLENSDKIGKRIAKIYTKGLIDDDEFEKQVDEFNATQQENREAITRYGEEIKRLHKHIADLETEMTNENAERAFKASEPLLRHDEEEVSKIIHRFIKEMNVTEIYTTNHIPATVEGWDIARQRGYIFNILAHTGKEYVFYYLPWLKRAEGMRLFEFSEGENGDCAVRGVTESGVVELIRARH